MIRALPQRSMPLTCRSCRSRSWGSGRYGTITIGKDRGGLLLRSAASAAAANLFRGGNGFALHREPIPLLLPGENYDAIHFTLFRLAFAGRPTFHRHQAKGRRIHPALGQQTENFRFARRFSILRHVVGPRYVRSRIHSHYSTFSWMGILHLLGKCMRRLPEHALSRLPGPPIDVQNFNATPI